MKPDLLSILRCPECSNALAIEKEAEPEILEGEIACEGCGRRYPIRRGVPRFVPESSYASSFGYQWKRYRRTQLDSTTGHPITRDRYLRQMGRPTSWFAGKRILDIGCGAGRFAEVALDLGATVVAVDLTEAVDAAYANLQPHPRLDVVQANAFSLPFADGGFDALYCFGVLQHTPDPRAFFHALPRVVAPGGLVAVDVYERTLGQRLHPRMLLRPVTRRMEPTKLATLVERHASRLLRASDATARVPLVGRALQRAVPVANYRGILPLDDAALLEWAILDTFDWLSPTYDRPQPARRLRKWARSAGLEDIEIARLDHLVVRGIRGGGR